MVLSSDIEYKKAKLVKQGKKLIENKFIPLANWISITFNVKVLDIQESLMTNRNMIKVSIHLETSQNATKFHEGYDLYGNFDSKKQNEIAKKYIELDDILKTPLNKTFGKFLKKRPDIKDVFVSFSAFEPLAKEEANSLIPEKKVDELQSKFKIPEIWGINRCLESAILFVYKDDQKKQVKNSKIFASIENEYFSLLKEYDEFDYWKRENFKIVIDSKQNFDENYESNWFYYYR